MDEQGLTIIEILVVIAIIGILAAASVVVVRQGRQKASEAAVLKTARSALSVVSDCKISGHAINPPPDDSNNGGGAICTSGFHAATPWPPLSGPWKWIGSVPADAKPGSDFVLQRKIRNQVYYISCSDNFGCTSSGPFIGL